MKQKEKHDLRSRERNFETGDDVFVRNYHHGDKWLPGTVEQKTGPVSYRVRLANGKTRRCHQDQVRKRSVEVPQDSHREPDIPDIVIPPFSPETTSANTESSTASPASETMPTENTNSEPALPDPIPTDPDAVRVNPTREKSYPLYSLSCIGFQEIQS